MEEQLSYSVPAESEYESAHEADSDTRSAAERYFDDLNLSTFGPATYKGVPPPQEYLVEGRLPRGKVVLLAGRGGEGKSMLLLQLWAALNCGVSQDGRAFGGRVVGGHQPCILLAGEDDHDEIARRLHAIGMPETACDHGAVVTAPDVEHPMQLVQILFGTKTVEPTAAFAWLERAMRNEFLKRRPLGFVGIDPASVFFPLDGNDAMQVQGALSHLTRLARRFNTTIIVVQHLSKSSAGSDAITAERLRSSVRGSTGWIDGVRAAYGLWKIEEAEAQQIRHDANLPEGDILRLSLLKANSGLHRGDALFLRQPHGVLREVTREAAETASTPGEALLSVIKAANARGQPINKTGNAGLYKRMSDAWPAVLQGASRDKLERLCNTLIEEGKLLLDAKRGLLVVEGAS